jgi:hypothetical protein
MRADDKMHQKGKSACSLKNLPTPELIPCPRCGDELEIWTDEEETVCQTCRHTILRKLSPMY